jgi:uncharacterized protein YjiK
MSKTLFLLLALCISFSSFGQTGLDYDFDNPTQIFKLPEYLEEVSALTYYDEHQLAMLNDELGRVFIYDLNEKAIVKRIRFKGNGDFEGIERVGDHIFAVESKGTLYKFSIHLEGVVEEIETPFKKSNNVEGLGFDPFQNFLLFALKDKGDVGNFDVKGRGIYAYDLISQTFVKSPVYVVFNKDLKRVMGDGFRFKPSGIAVHPITGELFILSAKVRSIMIFNRDGSPKNLSVLNGKFFPQPEGIAFMPDGTLYISNEMDDEGGTILAFKELSKN